MMEHRTSRICSRLSEKSDEKFVVGLWASQQQGEKTGEAWMV